MATVPERGKGAKVLPDGKIMLKDGTVMSNSAYKNQFGKYGIRPGLVQVTGSGAKPKPRVSAKEAAKQAKRGKADIKKGEKTNPMTNTLAASKKDTPAKRTARVAAAERARLVPSDKRTPAQKLAIKSASRMKLAGQFESAYKTVVKDAKRAAGELKAAGKEERKRVRGESKTGGRTSPGGPRGGRGGMGGGGLFGGGAIRKSK
jgi:uncharacterized membrane protein YgcG